MATLIDTFSGGTKSSHYRAKLYYTENSTSTTNNTSNITLRLVMYSDSSSYSNYGYTHTGIIKVDGTEKKKQSKTIKINNTEKELCSWTGNISHNSDGSKTINISFSVNSTYAGTASNNKNWSLTKILRKPNITLAPNFTDEENPTITWTRYASDQWQRAKIEVGTNYSFITRDVGKTATSCTFTLTDEERDRLIDAAGDNSALPVRFTVCWMTKASGGTEADEIAGSIDYEDRTMTVTPKGRIGKNGTWKRVQIYYGKNGSWKRCTPYIGKSGTWKRVK